MRVPFLKYYGQRRAPTDRAAIPDDVIVSAAFGKHTSHREGFKDKSKYVPVNFGAK